MEDLDVKRKEISTITPIQVKNELGQYLTPCPLANFMASMFDGNKMQNCSILDPGAGLGVLTDALTRHDRLSRDRHAVRPGLRR